MKFHRQHESRVRSRSFDSSNCVRTRLIFTSLLSFEPYVNTAHFPVWVSFGPYPNTALIYAVFLFPSCPVEIDQAARFHDLPLIFRHFLNIEINLLRLPVFDNVGADV